MYLCSILGKKKLKKRGKRKIIKSERKENEGKIESKRKKITVTVYA
jgi:hypothetical protein